MANLYPTSIANHPDVPESEKQEQYIFSLFYFDYYCLKKSLTLHY